MVQLPCQLCLFNLSFGKELSIVGNSLSETEIIFLVVVSIDTRITWTENNLFAVFGVDMETVITIAIVKHHVKLGLQVKETQDVCQGSLIMPHFAILGKLSHLVAFQNSSIGMQY